eukprot:scaffold62941_cov16-Tisochrysis_lutea.AAC.2
MITYSEDQKIDLAVIIRWLRECRHAITYPDFPPKPMHVEQGMLPVHLRSKRSSTGNKGE